MKQNFYKNSILKFVSLKMIKWLINTIFNKNKNVIGYTEREHNNDNKNRNSSCKIDKNTEI